MPKKLVTWTLTSRLPVYELIIQCMHTSRYILYVNLMLDLFLIFGRYVLTAICMIARRVQQLTTIFSCQKQNLK